MMKNSDEQQDFESSSKKSNEKTKRFEKNQLFKESDNRQGIQEEKKRLQSKADHADLSIRVSSTKIRKLKGTRAGAPGQAAVMGCSATLA